jgi:hypothetical protein
MPSKHNKATPDSALTQVLVAFGSGVGGLYISHAAAKAGLDRFRPVIKKNIANWDSNLPSLLAYATAIGRVAAHQALARGASTVTPRHLLGALKLIEEQSKKQGFFGCPFFHHHH